MNGQGKRRTKPISNNDLHMGVFTMIRLFATALVASALVGCASVPMGDPQRDAELKNFAVAPGKAGVYVYRNESMGAAVKMDVSLDGAPLGQTGAKTYLYKDVTPGKHTISSKAENTETIEFDAKPGSLTYVWQEVKMGVMSARSKLHIASEADGKKGVQASKLAQSN
jgi:hypothetical protein